MPESATGREVVALGEGRPAPHYPGCEIPSRPPRHSKSGRSEAEETATAEARRREAVRREATDRLREAEEAAQEAVRVRQAEEAAREEARLRRAGKSAREAEATRARQAACQAPDPTPPEATTTSEATHDEAAGAPLGPDPSGDVRDEPASGDAPESGTSIGGPSRTAPTPRRLSPLPSAAPLNTEPLLQALAAANTTVLDGRGTISASNTGVLDAATARERRATENEAASRRREEALKARATALEECARARERDLADRETAVAIREATLAAHEAACAEEESALRLREDALTERERALEEAEATAQRLADSLSLREAAREEQVRRLNSETVERRVGQLMISGPTTASNVPVPLCEKGAAEREAAINALPLTDIIGPLVDHQAAASLKEDVAKEASDVAAAAATTSGGNFPKRGRKFSSVIGNRRKTPTPSPVSIAAFHRAARAKAAQDESGGTSSASLAVASTDVVVVPRSREATPSGPASDLAAGWGPPAAVLTWEELQVEMGRLLEAGGHSISREIAEVRAAVASSVNERADRLTRDLAEVREDLQKMRELVAGNERQRQGLEHRMSELENLSEIRGSLRVTYTGLHQLAGECGIRTTIPANPDEFSLTSSLAKLATAMEAIPSKHAAMIGEETSNGIYTGACHVLACVWLAHPELDLQKILDQGAASDARKDVMEEVGDLGESILPLFEE
ncbi:uncharacterized protein [Oryza sativa Japonica Group]|uniref:uncharacterized protein n=1 Tax=Oryza sativa subsp. japonica TaxID=39947 RepID=UPI00339BE18F